jgi:hypothetical protein
VAPERCRAPGHRGPLWCSGGGVDEGAVVVASKRSWHGGDSGGKGVPAGGGSGDNRVLMAAACAPVATLMAVQRQQRVRKTKFYEGIQAERRVPDL